MGQHRANAWGLHDIHGNVSEWCADWYGTKLSGGSDPQGLSTAAHRVLRGGSWADSAGFCRSVHRDVVDPSIRVFILGFRVARVPSGG